MINRWNYQNLGQVHYGHDYSYAIPCQWFDEVGGLLEDWGCGCAMAKAFVKKCRYLGIDGSANEYADRCGVDLRDYVSTADCILLRDVLDHNVEWEKVLQNALNSFQKRMVIVVFRALGPETKVVFVNTSEKYPGVPDLQFCRTDLLKHIQPYLVREEQFANETLFFLEKKT